MQSYDLPLDFGYHKGMSKASFTKRLFQDYATELKRFVAKKFSDAEDAEDIVQDAFHNFLRIESPENLDNPRAYLYQTAQNLALNRIRKQRHHENYLSHDHTNEESRSPERTVTAANELEALNKALAKLPKNCRQAFILRRIHNKPYKEIAAEMQVSTSSVEKYLAKAIDFLRDNIDDPL